MARTALLCAVVVVLLLCALGAQRAPEGGGVARGGWRQQPFAMGMAVAGEDGEDADAELREDMRALGMDDMSEASMNELFHWAIEHSDPELLKSGAAKGLTDEEIVEQRIRMKRVLRELDQRPTEGQLMREIVEGLRERGLNVTEPDEVAADVFSLEVLQELVEPIDNANDLDKVGGLDEVIERTGSRHPEIRTAAYHVLGTAASNNDTVQRQVMDKGALRVLARRLQVEDSPDARVKALYAIGNVARYSGEARAALYEENLLELLVGLVDGADGRLRRKGLVLLQDFVSKDPEEVITRLRGADALARPLVGIVAGDRGADLDLREKAASSLLWLAGLPPSLGAADALVASGAHAALDALGADLAAAQEEDDGLGEYLSEIAELVGDVRGSLGGRERAEL